MPYDKSPNKMGHSPAEMGHSPMENQNKGYAKQERKDLIQDMPIDTRASSIINAGIRSRMGGQPKMGHSPAEMGHSPLEKHGGFHVGDAAKAFAGAAIKTAKKVKAAGSKIAKAVSADLLEGGSERKRKLREARGGAKPAKIFKK